MSWEYTLAKSIKNIGSKTPLRSAFVGQVFSVSPLKLAALENNAILSAPSLMCSKQLQSLIDGGELMNGDKVLCITVNAGTVYIAADKVV